MKTYMKPVRTRLDRRTGTDFQRMAEDRGVTEGELARTLLTSAINKEIPVQEIRPEIEFLLRETYEMRTVLYTVLDMIATEKRWGDDRVREIVARTRETAQDLAKRRIAEANREFDLRRLERG